MSLRINQNIDAVNSYRNLSVTQGQMSKSLEKLSSGFRINRAADDAAGLAISEGLRSQIGGLKVAVRNTQDGVSVVQTAEGALTETHSILQRMRDLAVQSSNDSNDTNSRAAINAEATALKEELTRIADRTTFNNVKLLDGSFTGTEFQTTAALTASTDANAIAAELNADTNFASSFTASVDDNGGLVVQSTTGLAGAITAGGGLNAAGTNTAAGAGGGGFSATNLGVNGVNLGTQAGASAAITAIDTAIESVSTARANLGALQNRFEHTINNLNVTAENLSASESRIRDTDMAQEMMAFTRSQILSQAGTAMLAQANQAPQSVLSLLR